jgi:ribosomal protein S18 acetylase RimI-like enzyme
MDPSSSERPPSDRPGPSIRHATVEDAALTARIRVTGWQTAYRGQLPGELLDQLSVEADTVRFADHLGHLPPERRVWVAEQGGEVVGFASTGPSRDEDAPKAAEIYAIYVLPHLYGRGIGGRLLRHAVEDLRARGYREVLLWTLATNVSAQRFYEREGWRADGAAKLDRLDRFDLNEVRYRLDSGGGEPG